MDATPVSSAIIYINSFHSRHVVDDAGTGKVPIDSKGVGLQPAKFPFG